ncbi:cupin domain-containing protein [Pseudomonas moorei]|nr:cupin domain-containing protein [Pseudomonas moorei]
MDQKMPEVSQANWQRPSGLSFAEWMNSRLALHATRQQDWETFAAQAAKQPQHGRAQIRYITPGNHPGTVAPGNFIFVNILMPPGHGSPSHRHDEAEEVFYVLQGSVKIEVRSGDEYYEHVLGPGDLLSVPPGLYRREVNVGQEDALMCVVLGSAQPLPPITQSSQE